jgi:hypothetical protein
LALNDSFGMSALTVAIRDEADLLSDDELHEMVHEWRCHFERHNTRFLRFALATPKKAIRSPRGSAAPLPNGHTIAGPGFPPR